MAENGAHRGNVREAVRLNGPGRIQDKQRELQVKINEAVEIAVEIAFTDLLTRIDEAGQQFRKPRQEPAPEGPF